MATTALITGITGQDGSYLTEFLLQRGYEVHGIVRRSSTLERSRLSHLYTDESVYNRRLFLHYADLMDPTTIRRIVRRVQPQEFYHLAGQSHVGLSFEIPESTADLTAMATLRILEILRDQPDPPRFLYAGSREIFGTAAASPQDETTPVNPNSPYGCAQAFAVQMTRIYREAHGFFCCNAICYNHESPRRAENFVTRKVTLSAARIRAGLQQTLHLGDLDAARDWGYAGDYVDAMWRMLQQDQADDYVLATGELHTIRDLLDIAFERVGLDWSQHVVTDPKFRRPADACAPVGNADRARRVLGWKPTRSFRSLIHMMVDADMERVSAS